jgi:hypothetical protein
MGSLITVLILTLVVVPLVVGGVLKGAYGAGRLLSKGKDQGVVRPISGPKLGRFGVWAIAWGIGVVAFVLVCLVSSYTQIQAGTVGVVPLQAPFPRQGHHLLDQGHQLRSR